MTWLDQLEAALHYDGDEHRVDLDDYRRLLRVARAAERCMHAGCEDHATVLAWCERCREEEAATLALAAALTGDDAR